VGPQRYTAHSSAPASAHYEPPLDAFARTQSSPHTFGARHDSHDSYNPYEPHELGAGLRETERQRRTQSVSASTRWSWLALFVLVGGGAGIGLWQLGKSQSRPDHVAARGVEQAPLAAATPAPAKQPTRELPFVPPVQPSAAATAQAATATDTHAEQVPPPAAAIPNLDQPVQADPPPTAAAPKPATPKPEAAVPPVAPVKPSVRTREPAAVSPQPVPPPPEPVAAPDNAPAQVVTLTQDTPAEPEPAPEPKIPDPPKVGELTSSATAALLRGEVGRAIELLRTATQVDPNHALAWRSLGLAYERSNNPRQALAAYERYLDLVPNGAQSEMVRERMQSLRAQ
jgi:hypothetical protein